MFDTKDNDSHKDTIEYAQHSSVYDTDPLNKAVEKANRDPNFINKSEKKIANQVSESTRHHPEVRTRSETNDQRIKDTEAVKRSEERSDYPEVPPSAMSNFVCDKCGKIFQNQNDLLQHKRFEG